MTEFLFFLNIGIVLIAFFVTSKKNNLQNLSNSIKHSSKMVQLEIDDTRRHIQNMQNQLSSISNNYENYYESALQQLEKYDSSKNIEKEIIKEKIYKLIDEYNDNRIVAKKKRISRGSFNNSSSSLSSYDSSYSSYTDFPQAIHIQVVHHLTQAVLIQVMVVHLVVVVQVEIGKVYL